MGNNDGEIEEFILSILSTSVNRLDSLSISMIRQKLSEHFGTQDFGGRVTDVVDSWLIGLVRESEALAIAVREAVKRSIADMKQSGRPITARKKTAHVDASKEAPATHCNTHQPKPLEGSVKKTGKARANSSDIQADKERSTESRDAGRSETDVVRSEGKAKEGRSEDKETEARDVKKDQLKEKRGSKDPTRRREDVSFKKVSKRRGRLERESENEYSDSDGEGEEALLLGLEDELSLTQTQETDSHSCDEPTSKRRKLGEKPVLHVNRLLSEFANGQEKLEPREYAECVIRYCQEHDLEVVKGKSYRTDSALRRLFKDKATIPRFPAKVVDALRRAHMITYWRYS